VIIVIVSVRRPRRLCLLSGSLRGTKIRAELESWGATSWANSIERGSIWAGLNGPLPEVGPVGFPGRVAFNPRNASRSNRPRSWASLISVVAGPAIMNDEGLADAGAANPFRFPRLHPGIVVSLDRRGEGFVRRLLCEFKAAEQTDKRGEDAARFSAVDRVDHESASAPGPAGSRSPRRAPAGTSRRPRGPRPCPWPRWGRIHPAAPLSRQKGHRWWRPCFSFIQTSGIGSAAASL